MKKFTAALCTVLLLIGAVLVPGAAAAGPALANTLVCNHYPTLVEMASLAQGIVLGWRHVIDSQIRRGRLVWASDHWASHGGGYFLITPEERRENYATRCFKRWLLEMAPNEPLAAGPGGDRGAG